MRRSLALLSMLALLAWARSAYACACCDSRSDIKLLGWAPKADRLLIREESDRACDREVTLEVFESERPEPTACFDLLSAPDTKVDCGSPRPSPTGGPGMPSPRALPILKSAEEKRYTRAVSSLTPDRVWARYSVKVENFYRRAKLEVFILAGGWTPLVEWEFIEYERDRGDWEGPIADLVPLELVVLPAA